MPPFNPLVSITMVKGWCKRMNLKSGTIERFEEFSQFKSLQEFNSHFEMWMVENKDHFSKSELLGLKRLIRFAAKIPGVCNAKIGTVLKAIYEEYGENGISRSTFKRMINKAETIGIFTVYETERKNGSQSSNLYVFNRFSSATIINEPPKEEILNHHNETINPSKTNKKNITKRSDEPVEEIFVDESVPTLFANLVKCFFPTAKSIEEFWRMTKIAAYRNNRENELDQVLNVSIVAFKQMISKLKKQKVHNPIAYFYGVLNKKLEVLYFEDLFDLEFEMAGEC